MKNIRHTGIVTKNIQKSLKFWRDLVGFKIISDKIERGNLIDAVLGYKNIKVRTIKLKARDSSKIELLYFYNPPKSKTAKLKAYSCGYTHISITVTDIYKIYKKFKKEKIRFNCEPGLSEDKKVIMTYCHSPEGGFLELVQEL